MYCQPLARASLCTSLSLPHLFSLLTLSLTPPSSLSNTPSFLPFPFIPSPLPLLFPQFAAAANAFFSFCLCITAALGTFGPWTTSLTVPAADVGTLFDPNNFGGPYPNYSWSKILGDQEGAATLWDTVSWLQQTWIDFGNADGIVQQTSLQAIRAGVLISFVLSIFTMLMSFALLKKGRNVALITVNMFFLVCIFGFSGYSW